MGIKAGEKYAFSAWFKNTQTTMTVYLENKRGEKLSDTLKVTLDAGDAWQKFSVDLSAAKTDDGILVMEFEEGSAVTLDDLCSACLFLVENDSVTGEILYIDGGQCLH